MDTLSGNSCGEDVARLTGMIAAAPGDARLWLRRARVYHKSGALAEALNDFLEVLRLDPQNSEAAGAAAMIQEIFDYRNTDIYNP